MSALAAQPPAAISADEWKCVQNLIYDVQQAENRSSFLSVFFQWSLALKQFSRMEWDFVGQDEHSEEEIKKHEKCVRMLMNIADFLMAEVPKYDEAALRPHHVSGEVIDVMRYELQHSWDCWHTKVDPERVEALRKRIFDGAP